MIGLGLSVGDWLLFYGTTIGPLIALAAGVIGSLWRIRQLGEKWLLLLVVVMFMMSQHQVLEGLAFIRTGGQSVVLRQEAFETLANVLMAGSTYYVLSFARRKQELAADLEESRAAQEQYQAELEQTNERLSKILESSNDAILLIDPQADEIVEANEQASAMLGYDESELLSTAPSEIHPHEMDRFERFVTRTRTDGGVVTDDLSCLRSDGRQIPAEISASPVQLGGDPLLVAAIRDITERRQRERRLNVLSRILRHNHRNNLNLIMGYADELKAVLRERGDEHAETARRIKEQAISMIETSDEIRRTQRTIDESRAETAVTDLRAVIDDLVESFRAEYPDAVFDTDLPATLYVHANEEIKNAFDHLLENAVEHNDGDTPRIEISCERGDGDWVTVHVRDNGPGIPELEQVVVEDAVDIDTIRHGSGIGLWVVRWIVEEFDGEIRIDDWADGTIVSVELKEIATPVDNA